MTPSTLTTDTSAPVRVGDRARTALRAALLSGRSGAEPTALRAARADRRAQVRADRSRRRAIAREFAAYPATRSAAGVLLPRNSGA
ncbi:hypothetical protein [Blastococcus sp. VKM Ac-2987]|uniref:hypothetical protein n=1 Tax=Blastococcus sp. VKM Ac-2987 TaxID=3004141 RepID=UPI0022ABA8CC|nr:hypothetical protein [Blastococcus sp. VKM Ac-2987]MCZ2860747.1 hypothetical protein [Blastococcus sp. VKM Ac-2987]